MLRLSDSQLDQVFRAAQPLHETKGQPPTHEAAARRDRFARATTFQMTRRQCPATSARVDAHETVRLRR